MKRGIFLAILMLLTSSLTFFAQYSDHRNRNVDSLENVLATNPPEGADLSRAYRDLMWGYLQVNPEKSMEYARKRLEMAAPPDDLGIMSVCYRLLAINFYHIRQYDSAAVYYDRALETAESMNDFPEKFDEKDISSLFASIYGNMGNLFNVQGQYGEAIAYYQKLLVICEKFDWKTLQANACYNMGELYIGMDNFEQAQINYARLDVLAREVGDTAFAALAKVGLSKVFKHYGDYEKALENANTAYAYYLAHPEEGMFMCNILVLLAGIHLEGYDDDGRAEAFARQALALADETDSPVYKSESLRLLSTVYLRRGQWLRAEQAALEALAASDSEQANTLAVYENLAKAYAHSGNASKAGEYIDKLKELQSTWSNRHFQSALREMEVRYESERKALEIERQQHTIDRKNMQGRLRNHVPSRFSFNHFDICHRAQLLTCTATIARMQRFKVSG